MTERRFSLCRLHRITRLWPSGPNGRKAQAGGFNPSNHISEPPKNMLRYLCTVLLIIVAVALTLTGFFSPTLPLWLAGLPLMAAIVAGTRQARAIAMGLYLLWPAITSASALVTLGYSAQLVWPLAALALMALATAAAGIGLGALAVILTLIAVFPASPVLLIADATPGTGLIGPVVLLIGFAIAEALPHFWQRATSVLTLVLAAFAWGQLYQSPEPPKTAWQVRPEPRLITERARWIALRDSLPKGAQAIFGENFFRADNHAATAFWCDAVRNRNLTLWIGVMAEAGRGQIWRFDPETCAGQRDAGQRGTGQRGTGQRGADPRGADPRGDAMRVHAARYGIPGLTGTWGAMDANTDAIMVPNAANPVDWLICFEAFLPRAWGPVLSAKTPVGPAGYFMPERPVGPAGYHMPERPVGPAGYHMPERPVGPAGYFMPERPVGPAGYHMPERPVGPAGYFMPERPVGPAGYHMPERPVGPAGYFMPERPVGPAGYFMPERPVGPAGYFMPERPVGPAGYHMPERPVGPAGYFMPERPVGPAGYFMPERPDRPVVILSNDRVFGSLPLSTLRHKVSRAMGRLTGRTVLHAETGQTFLLKGPA